MTKTKSPQKRESPQASALSKAQRAMVEENMGLVGLHIRRNVRNLHRSSTDRDFDDLFQEGCFGLIRAARSFDPGRGIPFAAYALPRIHTAVSTALHGNASLVRTPRRRGRRGEKSAHPVEPSAAPKVVALDREPVDRRSHAPWEDAAAETIGDRLRSKYDTALKLATRSATRRKALRADRKHLVERLIDQRLLVPEATAKRSLREIAAETGSSYSRVLQCEKKLQEGVRRALANDLEFQRLLRLSKTSPEGCAAPLGEATRRDLRALSAEAFWRRLILLDDASRDGTLARLARASGETGIKASFRGLEESAADALLAEVSQV